MARYVSSKRLCLVTEIGILDFTNLLIGSEYITNSEREIRAIEKSPLFKRGVIVREQEQPEEAPAPVPQVTVVPEVTNCVQAKDWLSANRGIEWKGLVSRAKIFEVAAEQHVEFVNLPITGKK